MSRFKKTIQREILERMPKDILLMLTNKEISDIFDVSTSAAHHVQSIAYDYNKDCNRVMFYKEDNRYEDEVKCEGAWMQSNERKYIKSKLL